MRSLLFSLVCLVAPVALLAQSAPTPKPAAGAPVYQARLADYGEAAYAQQVEKLIAAYEFATGRRLAPGAKKKVGLKIYTDSGPGMATPVPFVKFKDHKVYVLESGRYYDPVWFYDSPLPQRFDPIFAEKQTADASNTSTRDEDRKSFLATPLFLDADFWINLPVYTDHPTLGINGALVNATLWNASNTARFFRSPANAPAAVAEMSAIPELRETWVFTLASLEHYQFIGGPFFNSLYTVNEPVIWLSSDPVMMDALMRDRINSHRKQSGFEPVDEEIRTLEFAETLGVGSTKTKNAKIIRVDN
jgi:hypothetical protein